MTAQAEQVAQTTPAPELTTEKSFVAEVLEQERPTASLDEKEIQRLKNMTQHQRQAEGIMAKDRGQEILAKVKKEDSEAPGGYTYDFHAEENADQYLFFQKLQEVVNRCAIMNGVETQNQAFESSMDRHIPGLPAEHAPGAYASGSNKVYSGLVEYLEEFADLPKADPDQFPDYFRKEWRHEFNKFNWRDIQNLVSTEGGLGAVAIGGPNSNTQTGGIHVDRPRLQIPVQEALKLRDMVVSTIRTVDCPRGTDTYKYLVEDEDITLNSGEYRDGVANQNLIGGVQEGAPFLNQDVRAIDKEVKVHKVGISSTMTRELAADVLQARSFWNSSLMRRMIEYKENQFFNGDGSEFSMDGILGDTGIQTIARVAGDGTIFDSYSKFLTQYEQSRENTTPGANKSPDMWIMRPSEKRRLREVKDVQKRYIWGDPATNAPAMLWDYPIRLSDYITANTAVLINLSDVAMLIKNGIEVESGFKQGDWERHKFSIIIWMRGNTILFRPKSVMKCTGLNIAEA